MDDDAGPSTSGMHHGQAAHGSTAPSGDWDRDDLPDRVLRKAETVLAHRTDKILLVLERCTDNSNYVACLRTADALGAVRAWPGQRPLKSCMAAMRPTHDVHHASLVGHLAST